MQESIAKSSIGPLAELSTNNSSSICSPLRNRLSKKECRCKTNHHPSIHSDDSGMMENLKDQTSQSPSDSLKETLGMALLKYTTATSSPPNSEMDNISASEPYLQGKSHKQVTWKPSEHQQVAAKSNPLKTETASLGTTPPLIHAMADISPKKSAHVCDSFCEKNCWYGMFEHLKTYNLNHCKCDVPLDREIPKLGLWVFGQRHKAMTGKLKKERMKMLESIGFKWYSPNSGTLSHSNVAAPHEMSIEQLKRRTNQPKKDVHTKTKSASTVILPLIASPSVTAMAKVSTARRTSGFSSEDYWSEMFERLKRFIKSMAIMMYRLVRI